jgi:DNA-binding CsgD family transcriptional regulator
METAKTEISQQAALTPREHEIYNMLLSGKNPKDIAFNLNIAYDTVKVHQKSIYRKLGVNNLRAFYLKYCTAITQETAEPDEKPDPLLFQISPGKIEKYCTFIQCGQISDPYSTINLTKTLGPITTSEYFPQGRIDEFFIITGTMSVDYPGAFAAIFINPDEPTRKIMQIMKSFSFKALGDGNRYSVKVVTAETIKGDGWLYEFNTEKDKIMTITVKVTDDLIRYGWSGEEAEFIHDHVVSFEFHSVSRGPFNLKFWDIRLYN